MTAYRFGDVTLTPDSPGFLATVVRAYTDRIRPVCTCKDPGPEMYNRPFRESVPGQAYALLGHFSRRGVRFVRGSPGAFRARHPEWHGHPADRRRYDGTEVRLQPVTQRGCGQSWRRHGKDQCDVIGKPADAQRIPPLPLG